MNSGCSEIPPTFPELELRGRGFVPELPGKFRNASRDCPEQFRHISGKFRNVLKIRVLFLSVFKTGFPIKRSRKRGALRAEAAFRFWAEGEDGARSRLAPVVPIGPKTPHGAAKPVRPKLTSD